MAATVVRGGQVKDGSIQRVDLDVTTVGQSVIAKAIGGKQISLSATGGDAGTGDVTIAQTNPVYENASTSALSVPTTDTYLVGSGIAVPAGAWTVGTQYHCHFDMTKTAAGTAALVITIRMGTFGNINDTAILTMSFGSIVQTAAVDVANFDVYATFRSVGSGTSAVLEGHMQGIHNGNTTGLWNLGPVITGTPTASSGFNSATPSAIGVSFNGGASFSGTCQMVQAQLILG